MPSTKRFAFVREGVRNHPVIIATSAASIGVLLGAFVAAEVFAPVKPNAAPAPQVAVQASAPVSAAAPVAETTGSAPAGERVATSDCDHETWPYLSRPCIEQARQKRALRVISTDKLDKPTVTAIEAAPPVTPAPAASAVAAAPSPAVEQPATGRIASPPSEPAPAIASATPPASEPTPAFVAPPEPALAVAPARAEEAAAQPAVKAEPKEKRVAKKARHKTPAVQPEAGDEQENPVASNDSDDRTAEDRVSDRRDNRVQRRSGKPHIVARWTERYVDANAEDSDSRRVTTGRRGGGLFEGLFGIGRGDDD